MSDLRAERFQPAEYRVRLFLSVDLSGSTAFKNSSAGQNLNSGAAPRWVNIFQQFYKDFPAFFSGEFQKQKTANVGDDGCPKLWKAVGDELVFCGKISNQKACITALNSFVSALHRYRKRLIDEDIELNVKGAGWLAAFPEPNRTVQLQLHSDDLELLSASEALELSADQAPYDFDFLGKAIDTGFRVAQSAKPERFVLSVQLARLLASADPELGFNHRIWLDRPLKLKGVNRDEPYPMLYFDTMKHMSTEKIRELERGILQQNGFPDPNQLAAYLKAYCEVVGTDGIALKLDADAAEVATPESYNDLRKMIADHLSLEEGREFDGNSSAESDKNEVEGLIEGIKLNPLT